MLCYAFNLLMAFDRILLKGLLTYLLTYLLTSHAIRTAGSKFVLLCCCCSECPNITLYGNSSSECLETRYIYDEVVLLQRDVVDFHCDYYLAGTTTTYSWYVDGTDQSVTANTFRYNFTSTTAYAHVVECRGMIVVAANWSCNGARTINVTIIGKQ